MVEAPVAAASSTSLSSLTPVSSLALLIPWGIVLGCPDLFLVALDDLLVGVDGTVTGARSGYLLEG